MIDQYVDNLLDKHRAIPIYPYDWSCKNPFMEDKDTKEAQEHAMTHHFSGFCMENPAYFICEECSREVHDEGVIAEEVTKWPCDVWNMYSLLTGIEISVDEDW